MCNVLWVSPVCSVGNSFISLSNWLLGGKGGRSAVCVCLGVGRTQCSAYVCMYACVCVYASPAVGVCVCVCVL